MMIQPEHYLPRGIDKWNQSATSPSAPVRAQAPRRRASIFWNLAGRITFASSITTRHPLVDTREPGHIAALIGFHLAAGARVALRANAVVAAMFIFLFGMAPDGLATLRALVLGTVSSRTGWSVLAMFAGMCLALASAALPRITLGLHGWMRSLPASRREHTIAAIVALCVVQLFSVAWTAFAAVLTVAVYHAQISIGKLLAIPVIVACAAAFGLLTANRTLARRKPSHVAVWSFTRNARFGFMHWIRVSWAALPAAAVVGSLLLPFVFISFAYMIVLHNPGIAASTAHRTVRIAGSLAIGAVAASLSNALLRTRPTWSWSRSLPWSSTQRVTADAIAIGLPACVIVATLLPLDAWNAIAVLSTVPVIAASSAGALRAGATRQTGAAGEVVLVATIAGALVAVWPLLAVIPLATTPWIAGRAAARDRRVISSRFAELQHDAGADSAWLGAR